MLNLKGDITVPYLVLFFPGPQKKCFLRDAQEEDRCDKYKQISSVNARGKT